MNYNSVSPTKINYEIKLLESIKDFVSEISGGEMWWPSRMDYTEKKVYFEASFPLGSEWSSVKDLKNFTEDLLRELGPKLDAMIEARNKRFKALEI